MSIIMPSRGINRENPLPFGKILFESPEPAGRKITAGFTYIQRIGKAANYDVWFPDPLRRALETRLAAGQPIGPAQFPAQWAAIRQFELLHESGNHKIYDLTPDNLWRSMMDLSKSMRAGGYRITIATLGSYRETATGDELEILDRRLQRRLAQMIHMLYLDEPSEQANAENDKRLAQQEWDFRDALPHVGMVLGAQALFTPLETDDPEDSPAHRRKKKSGDGKALRHRQARRFFDIVAQLPQKHIVHDTAIGLQLPELNGENQWNYIADPEETLASFNRVLGNLFDPFNRLSLSRLNGHDDAHSEVKSSTLHLRSYGHPLNENALKFYRGAAHALH